MIGPRWVEVTTKIGCTNLCSYCPQSTLIASYLGKDLMTVEDFKKILTNVNCNTTQIHFSGFSEAFLNDGSEHMMVEATKAGFSLVLFTTLVGFTEEKAKILQEGKAHFSEVRFHAYEGFDKSSFDHKRGLFKSKICSDTYMEVVVDTPVSRGGHLWPIGPFLGPRTCSRFDCNVVLPNGDLYLCCSDWGLKHRIGNLYERHYDDIVHTIERHRLRKSALQQQSDILCRTCEWAAPIPQDIADQWLNL